MKCKCKEARLIVLTLELVILIALAGYSSASYSGINNFSVESNVNKSLILTKDVYPYGEEVLAYISNPEEVKEVSITGEKESYMFVGTIKSPIRFNPQKNGNYTIITVLNDKTKLEKSFYVVDALKTDKEKAVSVSTDKKEYILGESVIINLNFTKNESYSFSILSKDRVYNYIDISEGILRFIPEGEGRYYAQLSKGNDTIGSIFFDVNKKEEKTEIIENIKTDKKEYLLGEQVDIYLTASITEFEIILGQESFNFIAVLKNTTFIPKNPGTYEIRALVKDSNETKTINYYFSVKDIKETQERYDYVFNLAENAVMDFDFSEEVEKRKTLFDRILNTQLIEQVTSYVEYHSQDPVFSLNLERLDNNKFRVYVLNNKDINPGVYNLVVEAYIKGELVTQETAFNWFSEEEKTENITKEKEIDLTEIKKYVPYYFSIDENPFLEADFNNKISKERNILDIALRKPAAEKISAYIYGEEDNTDFVIHIEHLEYDKFRMTVDKNINIKPDVYKLIAVIKAGDEFFAEQKLFSWDISNVSVLLERIKLKDKEISLDEIIRITKINITKEEINETVIVNETITNETGINLTEINITEETINETTIINKTIANETLKNETVVDEIKEINKTEIITNLTTNKTLKLINLSNKLISEKLKIKDSKEEDINSVVKVLKDNVEVYQISEDETYEIKIDILNKRVKKITFRDVKLVENEVLEFNLGVDDVPIENVLLPNKRVINSFAINPTELNFTNATVTVEAKGNALFKCKDWNFSEQKCYGNWVKIKDLVIGEEYNISLTPKDPGFAEVIEITEAMHLDSDRQFISDIYEKVKALDDIWSEPIYSGEYVRVTFEQNLTLDRDITIYPRITSGNPRIEVYEIDGTTKIAEFSSLIENEYNKVFLTDLISESQDTFDLRVLEGSVEIDHIIDPTTTPTFYNVTTNFNSATHTSLSVSHTISGENTLLLVFCQGENQDVSGVTFGAQSLTNIPGATIAGNGAMVSTWYLAGATGTGTVTCNLSSQDNSGIVAISYTGVNQTSPIGNVSEKTSGASATPTHTLITNFADSMIVNAITGDGGDTHPITEASGQTRRWQFRSGTSTFSDTAYAGGEIQTTTTGTYLLNWTMSVSDGYSVVGVEIKGIIESGTTPPTIIANATKPDPVYTNTDWLLNITATDSDNATFTSYTQFYVNGIANGSVLSHSISNNTNTNVANLSSSSFNKGATLIAEYWAGDGIENTTKYNATQATVQNSVPTIQVQNTFVNCSAGHCFNVTAGVSDADGGSDITKTNISMSSGNCNNILNSTSGNYFNSTWNCSGTALASTNIIIGFNDSSGAYVNSTLSANTYPNRAPTQSQPILNSTTGLNSTNENLTCYNQSTYDADSDTVLNIYNWYKDDIPLINLYLPFEGGSDDSETKDYSGYENNGTVSGAAWTSIGGYGGNGAYQLDSADNDYIEIATDQSLNLSTSCNFTEMAWIYPKHPADTAYHGFIGYQPGEGATYRYPGIWVYSQTRIHAGFGNGSSWCAFSTGTGVITNEAWNHVVARFDGNYYTIFVNGSVVYNLTGSWSGQCPNPAYARVDIGRVDNYFNGTIDDVRIYNYALSVEQIDAIYQNHANIIVSDETSVDDVWICEVTPNDGIEDGNASNSTSLIILDGPSDNPPNITLEYPAAGYWNDTSDPYSVTFNCSITDDINSTNISLYLTNNQNISFAYNDSCTIPDADVNGSCNWTKSLSNGNYTWNCLGYDNAGQSDWDINRTVKINASFTVPEIDTIQCEGEGTGWENCSNIGFGDTLLAVRANFSEADAYIIKVKFNLTNIPDNYNYFYNDSSYNESGYWVFNNSDIVITDSGGFRLDVVYWDSLGSTPIYSPASCSGDWIQCNGVYADGGDTAVGDENNLNMELYNFDFSIPETTIEGIEVIHDTWETDGTGKINISLSWDGGTSWTTEKSRALTSSETTYTEGSSMDTWGRTWNASEINSSNNFRVKFETDGTGDEWNVDYVRVRVTYAKFDSKSGYSEWSVPWGSLSAQLISPSSDTNVTKNRFFNFTSRVSCTGGECGYVNATLDPTDWWNDSWTRRKEINITSVASSTLMNYTAYLIVDYDSDMFANFTDLRFINASCGINGSLLDYEIENYDSNIAHTWIRIPALFTGTTSICMYYGNPTASDGQNVWGVWSDGYIMVQHLDETSGTHYDSTSNNYDGIPTFDGTGTQNGTGQIDGADYFDGTNDQVSMPTYNMPNTCTVSAWINATSLSGDNGILAKSDSFAFKTTETELRVTWPGIIDQQSTGAGLTTNTMTYVAWTYDTSLGSANIKYYKNGVNFDSDSNSISFTSNSNNVLIANNQWSQFWDGTIDDVTVSNVVRSPDWINQSYQMQFYQSNFVNFGNETEIIKGVIPMNSGTPFYTTTQNPATSSTFPCLANMSSGDSCDTNWQVNATGNANTTWEFFVAYASLNYFSSVNDIESAKINITIINNVAPTVDSISIAPLNPRINSDLNCTFTILDSNVLDTLTANVSWYNNSVLAYSEVISVSNGIETTRTLDSGNTSANEVWRCGVTPYDQIVYGNQVNSSIVTILGSQPPLVNQIQCQEDGSPWSDCSNVLYGDNLTAVRANCSDPDEYVVNATFTLTNMEDSKTFFSGTTTDNSSGYFVYNSDDLIIADSGTFNLTVICYDDSNASTTNYTQWNIPWGSLSAQLISPSSDTNVTKNRFFNFTSRVSCTGGECGYVNATLDPTDWWNDSWLYRQQINLSVASGATPDDYQFLVNLSSSDVGPNFNWGRNCNDIRFTNSSGTTQLEYWIENCSSSSQTALIWVKSETNITTSAYTIYMYYGNPSVSNVSNGTATFDFFDDFSGDLSKWTKHKELGGAGTINIENGYVECGGGSTSDPYGHSVLGSNATYTGFQDGIIEGKISLASNGIGEIGFRGGFSTDGYKGRYDQRSSYAGKHFLKPPYYSWSSLSGCSEDGEIFIADTWYNFKIIVSGSSFKSYTNGATEKSCSDTQYTSAGEISLQNHYGSYTRYDDIKVRKYASPEPTYSIGTEEKASKGVVPVNSGDPFYTTTQNPATSSTFPCLANMSSGDSCDTNWQVNATGNANTTWEFFVAYASLNYFSSVNDIESAKINITIINNVAPTAKNVLIFPTDPFPTEDITCSFVVEDYSEFDVLTANVTWYKNNAYNSSQIYSITNGVENNVVLGSGNTTERDVWKCGITPYDQINHGTEVNSSNATIVSTRPPRINQIQCYRNNSQWIDCSDLSFHDVFSGVNANCTSDAAFVSNVTFNLTNVPDSQTYFHNTTTINNDNWWEFYYNETLNSSGMFKIEALCTDNNSETDYDSVNWSLPWGTLSASLVEPNSDTNVEKNGFFTFTAQVSCVGGECGDVNASLDPAPDVDSITTTVFNSDVQTHNVQMPATVEEGDLLLTLFSSDAQDTVTTPGGWTLLFTQIGPSNRNRGSAYAKVANGSEDGTTVNFITSGDEQAAAHVYRILAENWYGDITNGIATGIATTVQGTEPDPPSLTPSWGGNDTLWIVYIAGSMASASVSSWPTNYTNQTYTVSTGGGNAAAQTASCQRNISTTTENPGILTWSESTASVANTIAIRPANATYSTKSGLISMIVGKTPFYTISQNPMDYTTESCLGNMIGGDSCKVSWQVNATGEQSTTHEFWVDFNMTTNQFYVNDTETTHINITITDSTLVPPIVELEYPTNNYITNSSSVRFNCSATDNLGLKNMTLYGNFSQSFIENGSNDISGISNSTAFQRTLPDGTFVWNCLGYDVNGNSDWANSNNTFTVDTTKPSIELTGPEKNQTFTTSAIHFNFTATDNLDITLKCNITINSSDMDPEFNANSGSTTDRIIVGFAQGFYLWNVTCRDDAGNINTSETRNFTIIDLPPTVELITSDNIHQQATSINLQYNVSDNNNVTIARLIINGNENDTDIDVENNQINTFPLINLGEGLYSWTVNVSDISGLSAQAAEKYFTIDYTNPVISLTWPPNPHSTNSSSITFNYTVTDNLDSWLVCNITINGTVRDNNYNAQNNSPISRTISDIDDGIHYWNVTCFDDSGNSNISETRMINISAPPTVVLGLPAEGHSQNSSELNFYYTPADNSGFSGCNLIINGILNQTNSTPITNGIQNNFTLTTLGSGDYNWTVNCTDTIGLSTVASPLKTFSIDVVKPTITLYNPLPGEIIYSQTITFNYSVIDDMDQNLLCNLILDGSVNESNIPSPNGSYVNKTITIGIDGIHYWNVTCWDDAGNTNTSETRNFTSMIPPTVTLLDPSPNAILNYSLNVTFRYTSYDSDGLANSSLIINGVINQIDPDPENGYDNYFYVNFTNDGVYTWTVNATDANGMEGTATPRTLTIDTTPPNVTINHPYNNETIDWNNVTFNFTVTDNLDSELICDITIDDVVEYQDVNVNNGSTVIRGKEMTDGNYNWSVSCIDHANNTNTPLLTNFTVEAPPDVTLNFPISNYRTKSTDIDLNYTPSDFIGFENCTLFLNGVENETYPDIEKNIPNYFNLTNLHNGTYNWTVRCIDEAPDLNEYTAPAENFTIDNQEPTINLISPTEGQTFSQNDIEFNWSATDYAGTTIICNLTVSDPLGQRNVTDLSKVSGSYFNATLLNLSDETHYWNVTCVDDLGNVNISLTQSFIINQPDLVITSGNITFNNTSPYEGENITINATIFNIGGIAANNFIVLFYDGNPSTGILIDNQTISSLDYGENITVNTTWITTLGLHEIWILIDPDNLITELNENNNNASRNITISSWHIIYGQSSGNLVIEDLQNISVFGWYINISGSGNIFAVDYDSSIAWDNLTAVGADINGNQQMDDFEEIDLALGSTNFTDSVNSSFTVNGAPRNKTSFVVFSKTIANVSFVNSTNNTNFITGILWDSSDGGVEYNASQDLIFISKINSNKQGCYGVYDYEIKVPSELKKYIVADQYSVAFYVELR